MRFFEFGSTDSGLDKFVLILKNEVMSYARRRSRAVLNWANISSLAKKAGFEFLDDPKNGYETFKGLYDNNPILQGIIKDFNQNGIELKVPGAPDDVKGSGTIDSQSEVDKAAASAAPAQVAKSQETPQV
jgi:hypothetical protein